MGVEDIRSRYRADSHCAAMAVAGPRGDPGGESAGVSTGMYSCSTIRPMRHLAVITPVFNDSACLQQFLVDLAASTTGALVDVLIVNDGSVEAIQLAANAVPESICSVRILHLHCNLGHQRAIAVGLVEMLRQDTHDCIVVIDADGEDRPQDITPLLDLYQSNPESVIVAQRQTRKEAAGFRLFYVLYKWLFRILTGHRLDFGNFSLMSPSSARRMTFMTELWNHFPATVMRSRLPVIRMPLNRQQRYSGRSRMNFTALVNHGLAAIAAFIDTAFARLLVFAAAVTLVLAGLALGGVVLRLTTDVPIPGWAALGASVAMIGVIQVVAALVVLSFLTLSARSTSSPPPARFALQYVERVETVK